MDTVAVISASGKKLMPTNSYRARKLLKAKRAVIYQYRPVFTIQMVDREDGYTQPIEYKYDTGYQNKNVISCDAFSTYRSGQSIGDNKFVVIDTKTWEWETV